MSTVYRKSGARLFFKVEGSIVTTVISKEKRAWIDKYDSAMNAADIIADNGFYQSCTEEEFNTAYKEAMERISSGKIE